MQIFRMLTKEEPAHNFVNLDELLAPTPVRKHNVIAKQDQVS